VAESAHVAAMDGDTPIDIETEIIDHDVQEVDKDG
jgi:hypothetical protein